MIAMMCFCNAWCIQFHSVVLSAFLSASPREMQTWHHMSPSNHETTRQPMATYGTNIDYVSPVMFSIHPMSWFNGHTTSYNHFSRLPFETFSKLRTQNSPKTRYHNKIRDDVRNPLGTRPEWLCSSFFNTPWGVDNKETRTVLVESCGWG